MLVEFEEGTVHHNDLAEKVAGMFTRSTCIICFAADYVVLVSVTIQFIEDDSERVSREPGLTANILSSLWQERQNQLEHPEPDPLIPRCVVDMQGEGTGRIHPMPPHLDGLIGFLEERGRQRAQAY